MRGMFVSEMFCKNPTCLSPCLLRSIILPMEIRSRNADGADLLFWVGNKAAVSSH